MSPSMAFQEWRWTAWMLRWNKSMKKWSKKEDYEEQVWEFIIRLIFALKRKTFFFPPLSMFPQDEVKGKNRTWWKKKLKLTVSLHSRQELVFLYTYSKSTQLTSKKWVLILFMTVHLYFLLILQNDVLLNNCIFGGRLAAPTLFILALDKVEKCRFLAIGCFHCVFKNLWRLVIN